MATAPNQILKIIKNASWYDEEKMEAYAFNMPKDTKMGNKILILIESTANTLRSFGSNDAHTVWRTGAIRVFFPDSWEDDYEEINMTIIDELRLHDFATQQWTGPNYTPDTETIYTRIKYEITDFKEDIVTYVDKNNR